MHSGPHRSLLLRMESKTRIFERTDVWALSQKKFQSVTCSGGSSQSMANFSMVIDTVREKRAQVCCFLFTSDQRTINKFDARLMLGHRQVDTFIIVQLKVDEREMNTWFLAPICALKKAANSLACRSHSFTHLDKFN